MTDTTTTEQLLNAELRNFLAGSRPRYATIATINPSGAPHQIVIWYLLRGDEIVVNSRRGRRWPANLLRDGRANLAVYAGDDAVTLNCLVERSYDGDEARADICEMAVRYDPPEAAEDGIRRFRTEDRISFVLRPTRVNVHGDPR